MHSGQAQTKDGWTYRMLYPPAKAVQATLGGRIVPIFRASSVNDPALYQSFLALHIALEQGGEVLELESRWQLFLQVLAERHSEQRPRFAPVRQEETAVRHVQQRLEDCALEGTAVSLTELAEQVGLPPVQLLRAFKAATGLPPHAYQTQLRVERARSLLAAGLPPAQVALAVGFYDQSHLGRFFRETYGVTPGQYAAATRPALAKTS